MAFVCRILGPVFASAAIGCAASEMSLTPPSAIAILAVIAGVMMGA
jgi:hypothetical protein